MIFRMGIMSLAHSNALCGHVSHLTYPVYNYLKLYFSAVDLSVLIYFVLHHWAYAF